MGLDMYLYAQRDLPDDYVVVGDMLARINDGQEIYVSDYRYGGDTPDPSGLVYRQAVDKARLADAVDPESPGAYILSDGDNERDGFALRACVGYWRKANHIHAWFVEHVQDGVDECQYAQVERGSLIQLREACQRVLGETKLQSGLVNNGWVNDGDPEVDLGHGKGWRPILDEGGMVVDTSVAQELLPTQSGFFFGGTDYDEWYVRETQDTVKIIDRTLALPDDTVLYYHSSW